MFDSFQVNWIRIATPAQKAQSANWRFCM